MCYETQGQGRSAQRAGHRTSKTKLLYHSQRKIFLLLKLSKWCKCKNLPCPACFRAHPHALLFLQGSSQREMSLQMYYMNFEYWGVFPHENLTWKVTRIYVTISFVNNTQVIVWETQALSGDCGVLWPSAAWVPEFRFWGNLSGQSLCGQIDL